MRNSAHPVVLGRGFTLIEVAVSLALIAMIAAGLFASLRFGQRSHEKVVQHGNAAWQVFAAQRLLRSLIEAAYPQQSASTNMIPDHGIEGRRVSIEISADAFLAMEGGGLNRFQITLERGTDGTKSLVARWWPQHLRGEAAARATMREVLIDNVQSVEWSYFHAEPAAWAEEWQGREQLPSLIRLRLEFPKDDSRSWPELIVAPRLSDDANCIFDVVAQRCRSAT